MAKAHGSYQELEAGKLSEAMEKLTGKPTEEMEFRERDKATGAKRDPDFDMLWAKILSGRQVRMRVHVRRDALSWYASALLQELFTARVSSLFLYFCLLVWHMPVHRSLNFFLGGGLYLCCSVLFLWGASYFPLSPRALSLGRNASIDV